MFDFEEVENKKMKELEKRIFELDNQVKYWKSMYERERENKVTHVRYFNNSEEHRRTKEVLKIFKKTKDKNLKDTLLHELYISYGIIKIGDKNE